MEKYSFDRFVKERNKNRKKKVIRLVISFLIISAISYLFITLGLFKDNNIAYYGFMIVVATIVAYLNGYLKKEEDNNLDGYLDGKIIFSKDEITIVEETYPLEKIQRITIHNNDYVGKAEKDFGEFESSKKSHGVNNQIILDLGNRHFVEVDFKQHTKNEFEKLKHILIAYHKKDKLSFDDLVYILKLEYDIDKNELRKQINKRS